ncbi:MAG: cytochrome c3 family protein [Planctomycetota bacterium]|nr:cytochrome c3 family protein [Planctomycetota bacterium]
MHRIIVTVILLVGLFYSLIVLASGMSKWRLPDNQQGYSPKQPIAYSHRLHAGELGIDCKFCHSAAEHGQHAGIPSTDVCMKCHKFVTSSFDVLQEEMKKSDKEKRKPNTIISAELKELYATLDLDDPKTPRPNGKANSIPWVRVHNLPDFVSFDHSAHVTAGVACQKCHGPVESMERVRQFESLSMGWCVNCHRDATENGIDGHAVNASLNCTVCHH